MNIQSMGGISPLWVDQSVETADKQNKQPTLFADIFQSAIDNVKEADALKNDAQYRLATGQMDNPAESTIIATQWTTSVELLVQLRTRALDAYNELMRISL